MLGLLVAEAALSARPAAPARARRCTNRPRLGPAERGSEAP